MRKRNPENIGLPARWRYYHGAYYYQVPPGQEHHWLGKKQYRLGKTLDVAYREFAERITFRSELLSMEHLLDRYLVEVVPGKSPATQRSNRISIKRLRGYFGANDVARIRPKHIYRFRDDCSSTHGNTSAHRDLEVLSHSFTKAIEWGVIDEHPMAGKRVVKNPSKPRTRYVSDAEVDAFLGSAPALITVYVNLKLLLGLRKGDTLSIRLDCIKPQGILITPRKTINSSGNKLLFTWTPALLKAIDDAQAIRPDVKSDYLFTTKRGDPYIKTDGTTSGFDSIWQRAMKKALETSWLAERFTEHDLRAKVASDIPQDHAVTLMGHTNRQTTERYYRRKPDIVTPSK